jgi:mannose-6-phosphate isomerase class I
MSAPFVAPTAISDVEHSYVTPAADFRLSRIRLQGNYELKPFGPELLLCCDGRCELGAGEEPPIVVERGESVFVGACTRVLQLAGEAVLFRATVGTV